MKSKWITYKGKQLLYGDYSGFGRDVQALQQENDAVDAIVCQMPEGSVLSITDVRDSVGTMEAVEVLKKSSARTKPYIRKIAVVGVTGVRRILADGVARFSGQNMQYFDDIEAAKEWLVND